MQSWVVAALRGADVAGLAVAAWLAASGNETDVR